MVDMIVNAMIAGILGTIAFVVVKSVLDSQDTSTWTALERGTMPLAPSVIAILVILGLFYSLSKVRQA